LTPDESALSSIDDVDRHDLTCRLAKALDVAAKTVDALGTTGYEDSDDPSLDVGGDKVIAETAMLLHVASHSRVDPEIRERVHELAGSLIGPARSDGVLARAALHPSLAEGLAVPHVLLTRLGYPDPDVDSFLRSCVASLGSRGHELPPYGALEKLWLRDLWGLRTPESEWRRVLRSSVLGTSLDLLGGLREDSYAFTHGLMYATDFGATSRVLPRPSALVLDDARALLAVCVESGDYDLVGEILMAWPFVGVAWCASAKFAFRLLTTVEDEAGIVPGGTTNGNRLRSLTGRPRRLYALATSYHTAYVMGMLFAASLRPMNVQSCSIRSACADLDETILEAELAVDQSDVQRVLATLSTSEYRELGAFRLDLAISQAVRRGQYGPCAELMRRLDESGYAASPLVMHAKELLVRLALGLSPRTRVIPSQRREAIVSSAHVTRT
jgi:hypothetical protein